MDGLASWAVTRRPPQPRDRDAIAPWPQRGTAPEAVGSGGTGRRAPAGAVAAADQACWKVLVEVPNSMFAVNTLVRSAESRNCGALRGDGRGEVADHDVRRVAAQCRTAQAEREQRDAAVAGRRSGQRRHAVDDALPASSVSLTELKPNRLMKSKLPPAWT